MTDPKLEAWIRNAVDIHAATKEFEAYVVNKIVVGRALARNNTFRASQSELVCLYIISLRLSVGRGLRLATTSVPSTAVLVKAKRKPHCMQRDFRSVLLTFSG